MIYMRQKVVKKPKQDHSNQICKNTVMNMLKNKLSKAKNGKVNIENIVKEDYPLKHQEGQSSAAHNVNRHGNKFYVISKNKLGDGSDGQSKISESIIVHDVQKYKMDPHFHHRHNYFTVQKCFDFKINNQIRNHHAVDTYIAMLQKEKHVHKQELCKLKDITNHYNQHMTKCTKTEDYSKIKQAEISQLKQQIKSRGIQLESKELKLKQFLSMFTKSKQVMLSTVMQLIDTQNQLNVSLSPANLHQKTSSLKLCIQKIERILYIFSDNLKDRKCYEDVQTVEQLKATVKYQQKIINLIKQNENSNKLKQLCHQNALMRYEINRLTQHNQNLLHMIDTQQKTIEQDLQKYQLSLKTQNQSHNHHHLNSNQGLLSTSRVILSQTSKTTLLMTERKEFQITRFRLQEELKKVKDEYEIQKQFLIMQCQSKQKEIEDLKKETQYLNALNKRLNAQTEAIKSTLQIAKQSQKVLQEQNELLKHKIQYMSKDNESHSVTVEELLTFLNKSELKRYHKALIELISTYQLKISELTQSYLQQKQSKDHLNTYHKGLSNLLKTKFHDQNDDEELIDYCSRFDKIMLSYKETRIDIHLRQIKGYTIGIDSQARQNIQSELLDYIEQLRSRMPALTQEYLDQDGSSVANSSIHHFD